MTTRTPLQSLLERPRWRFAHSYGEAMRKTKKLRLYGFAATWLMIHDTGKFRGNLRLPRYHPNPRKIRTAADVKRWRPLLAYECRGVE